MSCEHCVHETLAPYPICPPTRTTILSQDDTVSSCCILARLSFIVLSDCLCLRLDMLLRLQLCPEEGLRHTCNLTQHHPRVIFGEQNTPDLGSLCLCCFHYIVCTVKLSPKITCGSKDFLNAITLLLSQQERH